MQYPQWGQPSFPPSPPYPPNRPPAKLLLHQRFWHWFRHLSRRMQIVGCAVLILGCSLCVGISAAASSTPLANIAATPTSTALATQGIAQIATTVPTFVPTPTPTSTPTATPTPRPKPTPTPKPKPTPTPCASPCNPWGYNFVPGSLIYNPPASFCSYFACIPNFYNGRGFVNECHDGMYSKSGGIRGDCSYHGGEWRPLYAH
jgi:hypothetical protein